MVGGRDIIEHIAEVYEILNNYKEKKSYSKVFNQNDEKLEFLEHCLECLEEYQKDLIISVCIEKISIRRYSKMTGFSRSFITKEKDKAVELLAKFFKVKFL